MNNLRQAAEKALTALEWSKPHADASITYEEAITALRAALEEPDRHALQAEGKHQAPCARHCEAKAFEIEIRMLKAALAEPEQEPVAWLTEDDTNGVNVWLFKKTALKYTNTPVPLYTAPPQRESSSLEAMTRNPLTDEEIDALELPPSGTATVRDLVRLIEAAHGIKVEK